MKKITSIAMPLAITIIFACVLSCSETDEQPIKSSTITIESASGLVGSQKRNPAGGRTTDITFDGSEGDPIDLATAEQWTANYRGENPEATLGHFFGSEIIHQILSQSSCVGIRIYYATDEQGNKKLLLVGVDASGNDLLPSAGESLDGGGNTIADYSYPCPNMCPPGGGL